MYIRFNDTGEVFRITGERRQFWLFDKNGEPGRAVKGSGSYTILAAPPAVVVTDYGDIKIREELEDIDSIEGDRDEES